jgi:hypothetical protein
MAALTPTSMNVAGVVTATTLTASASDTCNYLSDTNQLLQMTNTTAGSLTLTIKGSNPSATYPVTGKGLPNSTQDLTAGLAIVVAAGQTKVVNLDKISAYLAGTGVVTMTGATGLSLVLYNN